MALVSGNDRTMDERDGNEEKKKKEPTRRGFLKGLLGLGALGATGAGGGMLGMFWKELERNAKDADEKARLQAIRQSFVDFEQRVKTGDLARLFDSGRILRKEQWELLFNQIPEAQVVEIPLNQAINQSLFPTIAASLHASPNFMTALSFNNVVKAGDNFDISILPNSNIDNYVNGFVVEDKELGNLLISDYHQLSQMGLSQGGSNGLNLGVEVQPFILGDDERAKSRSSRHIILDSRVSTNSLNGSIFQMVGLVQPNSNIFPIDSMKIVMVVGNMVSIPNNQSADGFREFSGLSSARLNQFIKIPESVIHSIGSLNGSAILENQSDSVVSVFNPNTNNYKGSIHVLEKNHQDLNNLVENFKQKSNWRSRICKGAEDEMFVMLVQKMLNAMVNDGDHGDNKPFYDYKIDGIFGDRTQEAVKKFKEYAYREFRSRDGTVDETTFGIIKRYYLHRFIDFRLVNGNMRITLP